MRASIRNSLYFLIGLLGFTAVPASAATEMFLCSGELQGEATNETYVDCIDVLAWSWGSSSSGTTHDPSNSGVGEVNYGDLSVTKWVDKSTPNLMKFLSTGEHLAEIDLVNVRQPVASHLNITRFTWKT